MDYIHKVLFMYNITIIFDAMMQYFIIVVN